MTKIIFTELAFSLSKLLVCCGGGGMTNGLRQAGTNVIAGVDLDSEAKETYEVNNAPARFVNEDITKLS